MLDNSTKHLDFAIDFVIDGLFVFLLVFRSVLVFGPRFGPNAQESQAAAFSTSRTRFTASLLSQPAGEASHA